MSVQTLISKLGLEPHPEGGFYRQTFVSEETLPSGRPAATSILFLLTHDNPSKLHRLDAEEMWYYQSGDPLIVHMIDDAGTYSEFLIGPDLEAGQVMQAVVPPNVWFGSSVAPPDSDRQEGWALVGCMVTPGFQFDGFELARRGALIGRFPDHRAVITKLTPET
ncbi:MAG: cupin domain-containing protein [Litorimonas sp.]